MVRKNLRDARRDLGMTQQELADRLGISLRHYQRVESGSTYGTLEMWDRLEEIFTVHQRVLREIHPGKEASR